jgi:hypothetical protein
MTISAPGFFIPNLLVQHKAQQNEHQPHVASIAHTVISVNRVTVFSF